MRYHDKKESIRQYKEQKYLENLTPKGTYQKVKSQENPEVQLTYKIADTKKIQKLK